MKAFDFLGHLLGTAVRRKLEADVRTGGGAFFAAVQPVAAQITDSIVQAEAAKLQVQATNIVEAAAGKVLPQ